MGILGSFLFPLIFALSLFFSRASALLSPSGVSGNFSSTDASGLLLAMSTVSDPPSGISGCFSVILISSKREISDKYYMVFQIPTPSVSAICHGFGTNNQPIRCGFEIETNGIF